MKRRTYRRWWVPMGPLFKIATNEIYGLTAKQLAEWDQWLIDRRPRTRIHLP